MAHRRRHDDPSARPSHDPPVPHREPTRQHPPWRPSPCGCSRSPRPARRTSSQASAEGEGIGPAPRTAEDSKGVRPARCGVAHQCHPGDPPAPGRHRSSSYARGAPRQPPRGREEDSLGRADGGRPRPARTRPSSTPCLAILRRPPETRGAVRENRLRTGPEWPHRASPAERVGAPRPGALRRAGKTGHRWGWFGACRVEDRVSWRQETTERLARR